MRTGIVGDHNLEKHIHSHMGCMAGFLHIFDRHHTLAGKRLPPAREVAVQPLLEGAPKFSGEAPRLSLDSRAMVDVDADAKEMLHSEKQGRSTSVIAKLMGLEPLPEVVVKLRRSPSESRDLPVPQCRLPKVTAYPPMQRVPEPNKSFYDSTDFFPKPKHTVSVERRLRMRGINLQPSKEVHTLQLKGLLHSNQSPIVLMKPTRNHSPPPPLCSGSPTVSNQTQRSHRNVSSQSRVSPNRRKQSNAEPHRKVSVHSRRVSASVSPVHSPKVSPRSGSPRMTKNIERKDKVLVGADKCFSTSSYPDTQRYRWEECKDGKDVLDRCDKLVNSIAEITAANELQPSPVSVLDSSFYKDHCCSPTWITKDEAAESGDDMWSAAPCSSEEAASDDCDFVYVSEILRACTNLPEESDIFLLLEKHQCLKGKDTSKASTLQRRLIFDTLQEILKRNQELPPWKAVSCGGQRQQIWSEFRRIREREESEWEDLFKVICRVLKKDMADEMRGWGEWPVEMGGVVLDIERLVFKDLVGETIRQLASFSPQCNTIPALRRKLVF